MSDISKSNMHESTMLPMAQQTNSQIKEHSGGKLRERSRSYFILETKKSWRGRKSEAKEEGLLDELFPVSSRGILTFFVSSHLLRNLIASFISPLLSSPLHTHGNKLLL